LSIFLVLIIGLALIFLGFILMVVDALHSSAKVEEYLESRREFEEKISEEKGEEKERKRRVRSEGLILVGPFPIVIKSERASRLFEIIVILSLVFFFIIFIIFLIWAFFPTAPVHLVPH